MGDYDQNQGDGLYKKKYHIQKVKYSKDHKGIMRPINIDVDDDAEYFVLRLDEGGKDPEHIKACRIGVHAYADAIAHHLPQLAVDLKERYPLLP